MVEALRHFILDNGHPVAGVAWRLGLSYITLRKVLDGKQVPQTRTLQLIANYRQTEASDSEQIWKPDKQRNERRSAPGGFATSRGTQHLAPNVWEQPPAEPI
jgi:hypothetical protein